MQDLGKAMIHLPAFGFGLALVRSSPPGPTKSRSFAQVTEAQGPEIHANA